MSNPKNAGGPPPPRTDINAIGETTAGGTPTGTGISGNEVPPVPMMTEDEEEDDLDGLAPGGVAEVDPVAGR